MPILANGAGVVSPGAVSRALLSMHSCALANPSAEKFAISSSTESLLNSALFFFLVDEVPSSKVLQDPNAKRVQ